MVSDAVLVEKWRRGLDRLLLVCLLLLLTAGLGEPSPLSLVYRHAGEPLRLDLYRPAENVDRPTPLVVYLHGGGWQHGSRQPPGLPLGELLARGFAVASVDYRTSAESTFPGPLEDVIEAIRFLRSRPGSVGLDPRRVALWGRSAGAHLAALAALAPGAEIGAVVDLSGPTDLLALDIDAAAMGGGEIHHDAPGSPESKLLGLPRGLGSLREARPSARLFALRALERRASPVAQVRPGAPPFFIGHGMNDRLVPPAQASRLADALRRVGGEVDLHIVPGGHHLLDPELDRAAIAFLVRHLAIQP